MRVRRWCIAVEAVLMSDCVQGVDGDVVYEWSRARKWWYRIGEAGTLAGTRVRMGASWGILVKCFRHPWWVSLGEARRLLTSVDLEVLESRKTRVCESRMEFCDMLKRSLAGEEGKNKAFAIVKNSGGDGGGPGGEHML